jgi:hypothetical protein
MERAAIGIRAHSGWAAAVVVAGDLKSPEILLRERIVVMDGTGPRANQPYHYAKGLSLSEAELYLADCATSSRLRATKGLEAMLSRVRQAGCAVTACGILTASGRPIPALPEILASHAMIHTAEGEFFRNAFANACDGLKIAVTRVRERELFESAAKQFRASPSKLRAKLTSLGRHLGPPWTQDQKNATLVAWLLLHAAAKWRQ